jgi:hypothetical protein
MDTTTAENQVLTVEALLFGGETTKGAKNLQAITLYTYKNFFIVTFPNSSYIIS